MSYILFYLLDKDHLLILDNLEHLLEGATGLSELLEAVPRLKLLVTSRESLHLHLEHIYDVTGLALAESSLEADTSGAVELFSQRARMQQPNFVLGDTTIVEVAAICELLGGMPLAIELASSWLRFLSIEEIKEELVKG